MSVQTEAVTVCVPHTGNGGEGECPLDGEYLLPDYCPDIAAILKCTVKPTVLSRRPSGETLIVEGQCAIGVLYLDEERKCLRSFSCTEPFSCTVTVQQAGEAVPFATARVSYVNCRAAGPRRIGIHGALTVRLQTESCSETTVLSDIVGDGICERQESLTFSAPVGTAERELTISEVVELGSGKPPMETPLHCTCTPLVAACKQLPDKAIVKGSVQLRTLYATAEEAGKTATVTHEFPFSQILELEGLDADCSCVAHAEVLTTELHAAADPNGVNTLLAVSLKLCIRLCAYRDRTVTAVTDAYSTVYPCEKETVRLATAQLCEVRQDRATLKEVLELPSESMAEIVDLWCELLPVSVRQERETAYIDGHLQISLLARDRDGCITYYEHADAYTLQYDCCCDELRAETVLDETAYAVVGGKLEVRLELDVCRLCYTRGTRELLCRFETAQQPYPAQRAAVRMRRARRGESVWELARDCHTAPAAVKEENGISGDTVPEDMLLLLPLC